jgi:hypothetical protein
MHAIDEILEGVGDDVADRLPLGTLRRIAPHELRREAARSDGDALAPPQDAVGQGDLEAAAAEIEEERGAGTEGHARPDTREHQTGLLPAVDESDRYPGGRFEQGIELVTVRSLTQRARPDGYETVDTGALGDVAEPKDGLGRACGELGGSPAGPMPIPRLSTTRSRSPETASHLRPRRRRGVGTSYCRDQGRPAARTPSYGRVVLRVPEDRAVSSAPRPLAKTLLVRRHGPRAVGTR